MDTGSVERYAGHVSIFAPPETDDYERISYLFKNSAATQGFSANPQMGEEYLKVGIDYPLFLIPTAAVVIVTSAMVLAFKSNGF